MVEVSEIKARLARGGSEESLLRAASNTAA